MAEETVETAFRWRVGDVIAGLYEVGQVHEDGGMGLVYRVRHRSWDTDLAVKCPRPEVVASAGGRERFAAEAEAWVSLGLHPNVCGCHYVRLLGGLPLVFAEYVPGGSLRDWIDDGRLYAGGDPYADGSPRDRIDDGGPYAGDTRAALARILDLSIQVAWGLAHAHDRGLVHQDVKPSNVLIDTDGTAKVTDFGLARARPAAWFTSERQTSPDKSVLVSFGGMTRVYASPEQAAGETLGRRTDVYSFAVSVLEMFTGGVTWMVGEAAGQVLEALRTNGSDDPERPDLPPGLADLLGRCLREDPGERPGSMREIATELADIHQRVLGRAYPRTEPAAAELRADELNNRALSLLDLDRPAEAEEAFKAALAADRRHLSATYNFGLLRWRKGTVTDLDLVADIEAVSADTGDRDEARRLLAQIHRERGDVGTPIPDALLMPWYAYERRESTFGGITSPMMPPGMTIRLTPDASRAVTVCDGILRSWDLQNGQCLVTIDDDIPDRIAISADGLRAVSGGKNLRFWDLASGERIHTWSIPGNEEYGTVSSVTISADARLVVAGFTRGHVIAWDLRRHRFRYLYGGYDNQRQLVLSADGRRLLAGHNDHKVWLWWVDDAESMQVLGDGASVVTAMCFGADDRTALTAHYDHTMRLWDLYTGECLRTFSGPRDGIVEELSISDDGRFALAGGIDHFGFTADDTDINSVRLWDLTRGRCLRTYTDAHRASVRDVLLHDGRGVSVGKYDLRRWPLPATYSAAWQLSRPRRHEHLSRLDQQAEALVTEADEARTDGRYRIALDLLSQARMIPGHERDPRVLAAWRELGRFTERVGLRGAWSIRTLTGHTAQVFSADLSADGRVAVTGGMDKAVRLWDVDNGACLHTLPAQPSSVDAVALSADGSRALTASRDGTIGVWSVETGECLSLLDRRRTMGAKPAWFSADGRLALVGAADWAVRLWDLETGTCLRTVEQGLANQVSAVWLSPDGTVGASAGGGNTARIWDLGTGELRTVLSGHTAWVMSLSISPDGRLALTAGGYEDKTIRLWDATTGECLRVFDTQPDNARVVRFSPDGRFALSGGKDRTLRVWDIHSGRCVRVLDGHHADVNDLVVTPDGRFALSAGSDRVAHLWELDWDLGVPVAPGDETADWPT